MKYFRNTSKSTLYLWIASLSIALLCAQGVKLHVHTLDHDHDHHNGHVKTPSSVEHTHLSIAHLSTDASHGDHHEEVLSESDASPSGLLMKITGKVPFMALLVMFITWVLTGLYRFTFSRRHDDGIISFWRYHFTPPLRAPPC